MSVCMLMYLNNLDEQVLGPLLMDGAAARQHFNVLVAACVLNQDKGECLTSLGDKTAESMFEKVLQEHIPFNHWSTYISTHLTEHI
jgi:hypothetical protein